jgi:hypothetical protein
MQTVEVEAKINNQQSKSKKNGGKEEGRIVVTTASCYIIRVVLWYLFWYLSTIPMSQHCDHIPADLI